MKMVAHKLPQRKTFQIYKFGLYLTPLSFVLFQQNNEPHFQGGLILDKDKPINCKCLQRNNNAY